MGVFAWADARAKRAAWVPDEKSTGGSARGWIKLTSDLPHKLGRNRGRKSTRRQGHGYVSPAPQLAVRRWRAPTPVWKSAEQIARRW